MLRTEATPEAEGEFLAELLWGQRAPVQSKKYLRQVLWQVQSALASRGEGAEHAALLSVDGELVRCNERCDPAGIADRHKEAERVAGAVPSWPGSDERLDRVSEVRCRLREHLGHRKR
jgi:hypothetical protein